MAGFKTYPQAPFFKKKPLYKSMFGELKKKSEV
jgi:hypothetical protein